METKVKRKTGIPRLIEITRMRKWFIIPAVMLSAFASIASFLPYLAIFQIVKTVLLHIDDIISINSRELIQFGWLAFGGVLLNVALYFMALVFSHLAAFGTLYLLKVDFASHLANIPLGVHIIIGSGKLRKIMDENIEDIETFIAHQLPDIVAAFIAPIVMIIILLSVDIRLGAASMVGLLVAFVVQLRMYGNHSSKIMMQRYQSSLEQMNNAAVEYVRGISVVKAFGQTVYSFRRLHDTIKEYTNLIIPYTLSWENSFSVFTTLINNIYLFVVPFGILIGVRTNNLNEFIINFVFYLLFVPSVAAILMKIMYVNSNSMRIINGIEAMDQLLDIAELVQPNNPKTIDHYDLEFKNVHFCYNEDKESKALDGISFIAPQGKVTAIVGPSGGGKSTIAHLIPRFFDVNNGEITLGGINIKEMKTTYLMEQVSFVFQDVFLFKQTVMDNIRIGNLNATDQQVMEAAKAAQCHDFIQKLPRGYQTVIGAKGVHLSGGEKQRIAIARAIVKDAPVIVLDEATAFSDPENEHLIQLAFEKLMKNKTVIMIAHRLSTVRNADTIIVVDQGKVVEQGRHNDLIRHKGKYFEMYNTYTQTVSWSMRKAKAVVNNG